MISCFLATHEFLYFVQNAVLTIAEICVVVLFIFHALSLFSSVLCMGIYYLVQCSLFTFQPSSAVLSNLVSRLVLAFFSRVYTIWFFHYRFSKSKSFRLDHYRMNYNLISSCKNRCVYYKCIYNEHALFAVCMKKVMLCYI